MSTIQATAVRGASWTIVAGFGTRILSLVASVVITHYVDPASLGDVGAAGIFVQTANSFSTLGMGQYVIAKKDLDRSETFHVTVLNVVAVAIAVAVAMAIRVPLGKFLNVTDSARYLPWFMATFVLDRASFIPERLLIRQLQFRRIAAARAYSELASGISAIAFAMLGWGGFALVVASAVRSVIKAVIFVSGVRASEWLAPAKLHLEAYRRVLHFGLPIAGQGILLNAASRWDNLVFTYLFGDAALARYNVAYNLADVPADQVGEQIAEVMLPSFARMAAEERDGAVVEITGLTALLIFPLSVGLGAVASTLVQLLLRPEWYETGGMLTILAALSLVRPLSWQANAYFIAVGTPRVGLLIDAFKLAVLFASMFALSHFGQLATCGAVGVAFGAALAVSWFMIARRIHRSVWDFVRECLPALAACAVMSGAVLAVRFGYVRLGLHNLALRLVLEVLVGAVAYVGALPIVAAKSSKKMFDLLKQAYRSRTRRA